MNILLLGSGGRESALAWKISQSPECSSLIIAPGNGGTARYGRNLPLKPTDFNAVLEAIRENAIDMVVVGNEDPLVGGITDFLAAEAPEVLVVGPSREGARLEGSKDFAKQFMEAEGIPTARYRSFTAETVEEGKKFLATLQPPYVLKADGLAAGKGVLILDSLEEARRQLEEMFGFRADRRQRRLPRIARGQRLQAHPRRGQRSQYGGYGSRKSRAFRR